MLSCNICGKKFERVVQLNGHKSSHNRPLKYSKKSVNCAYCSCLFEVNQSSTKKFCSVECFQSKVQDDKDSRHVVIRSEKHGNHTLDITVKELNEYRSKQSVCEICGNKEVIKKGKIKLSTDHNHKTCKFRGLLCYSCNVKLAWVEKEWKSIQEYLKRDSFIF